MCVCMCMTTSVTCPNSESSVYKGVCVASLMHSFSGLSTCSDTATRGGQSLNASFEFEISRFSNETVASAYNI